MKFEDSVTKLENCGDALVVAHNGSHGAYEVGKRTFDILSPLFVIVGFSWLFALIALVIKLDDSQGVVIFRQTRVGKKGDRTFSMWKFRSMCSDAKERLAGLMRYNEKDGPIFKMAHNPRDTRVGHFICKYWQVQRNRDSLTFNEWVGLLYVKTRSFFTDLKLIFRTVGMILIAWGC
jgi:lipopolysaccharide/colanic/teichoic acid biosynthesis glycosyltransferase